MTLERRSHLDATAVGCMVLLCALWGLQQVAIKVANAGVSPILQAGLRSAGAVLLLWAWSAWRGQRLFARDGALWPGLAAGLLFAAEFLLIYTALVYTSASRGVLLLYAAPFWTAIGLHLTVPGERLTRIQALGLVCAFVGVAVAFTDALRLPTWRELTGDLMILLAGVLWAATTVVIRATRLIKVPAAKTLFYQLGISALVLPVASLVAGEPGIVDLTPALVANLAYQTVVVAFASYLTWFWLITRYPASRLAAFSFLTPLFGVLAGGLILSEPITPALVAALLLVAAGINLVNRKAAPTPAGPYAAQKRA
ncbi:DMT family transporter [Azospirillum sp. sgz301742]